MASPLKLSGVQFYSAKTKRGLIRSRRKLRAGERRSGYAVVKLEDGSGALPPLITDERDRVVMKEVEKEAAVEEYGEFFSWASAIGDLTDNDPDLRADALDAAGSFLSELNDRLDSFTADLEQRLDATEAAFADV